LFSLSFAATVDDDSVTVCDISSWAETAGSASKAQIMNKKSIATHLFSLKKLERL